MKRKFVIRGVWLFRNASDYSTDFSHCKSVFKNPCKSNRCFRL